MPRMAVTAKTMNKPDLRLKTYADGTRCWMLRRNGTVMVMREFYRGFELWMRMIYAKPGWTSKRTICITPYY